MCGWVTACACLRLVNLEGGPDWSEDSVCEGKEGAQCGEGMERWVWGEEEGWWGGEGWGRAEWGAERGGKGGIGGTSEG